MYISLQECIIDPITIKYANGNEDFIRDGSSNGLKLIDFWAWAYSDCINNTNRGVLAEFLVATALGIDLHKPRDAWAKYDITYRGVGVEVKSAGYHQRWYQKKMSKISFNVPTTRAWDEKTNKQDAESKRQAFIYILCLLAEKKRDIVNPLNINQWLFWVIPTNFFDARQRSQHSITYNSLVKEVGEPVSFDEIKPLADNLIKSA